MGKRKRDHHETVAESPAAEVNFASTQAQGSHESPLHVQIITGSYDKVLHGVVASVSVSQKQDDQNRVNAEFRDNFLFNAHGSAIRCLAVSPISGEARAPVVTLASGGTDERINLYRIAASVSSQDRFPEPLAKLQGEARHVKDARNKELGSLLHHASAVTALHFPTRSKLLSSANDNTIAVSRARDWTVLSTFKAPLPKATGRPSGDTAPPGGTPAGINDFAVHPSMKLMISVSKGEKCMRLWNLVTGKKAGALNFGREILQSIGEGKWSNGEGRRVAWNRRGDGFAVVFERGIVIFGMVTSANLP